MPVLYGAPLSPFVRKVAVVLEEKGICFEWNPVRPHDFAAPEFLAISPLGKIPAYKDEHASLADSSIISFYLEKTHPETPLYPADTSELVRALWFEEYFDGGMVDPMNTIYFHQFFNPLLGKPANPETLKEALEKEFPPMLKYLEGELKQDQWLVGNMFSIADISIAAGFINLEFAGYTLDAKQYPKLTAHIARAYARTSFKKCNAFARTFLESVKKRVSESCRG